MPGGELYKGQRKGYNGTRKTPVRIARGHGIVEGNMSSCDWNFAFEEMKIYHDTEWGVPVHDDLRMFEYLMLEVMQCGLSWNLMIKKTRDFPCLL